MMNLNRQFEKIYHMPPNEVKRRFRYLGEGISRAVFQVDNKHAAKFATCLDGIDQCALENQIYNFDWQRYGRYLCPVIWYHPGMIVMPKALPIKPIYPHRKFNIDSLGPGAYDDLKSLSRKYNLLFEDITSPSSWGILGNRPVLIDYGCTN